MAASPALRWHSLRHLFGAQVHQRHGFVYRSGFALLRRGKRGERVVLGSLWRRGGGHAGAFSSYIQSASYAGALAQFEPPCEVDCFQSQSEAWGCTYSAASFRLDLGGAARARSLFPRAVLADLFVAAIAGTAPDTWVPARTAAAVAARDAAAAGASARSRRHKQLAGHFPSRRPAVDCSARRPIARSLPGRMRSHRTAAAGAVGRHDRLDAFPAAGQPGRDTAAAVAAGSCRTAAGMPWLVRGVSVGTGGVLGKPATCGESTQSEQVVNGGNTT
jgi:hypothetical protein